MLPMLVFNSAFLARIGVHPYIYHNTKLKDLLLAALLDYLQKKFLKHFKYSKTQDDGREHMTEKGTEIFSISFFPSF